MVYTSRKHSYTTLFPSINEMSNFVQIGSMIEFPTSRAQMSRNIFPMSFPDGNCGSIPTLAVVRIAPATALEQTFS